MRYKTLMVDEELKVTRGIRMGTFGITIASMTGTNTFFGADKYNTKCIGKEVRVTGSSETSLYSTSGSVGVRTGNNGVIGIISGASNPSAYNNTQGVTEGIVVKSNNGNVAISSNKAIKMTGTNGLVINNAMYGNTLPTSNNTEGRVFFKLLS